MMITATYMYVFMSSEFEIGVPSQFPPTITDTPHMKTEYSTI